MLGKLHGTVSSGVGKTMEHSGEEQDREASRTYGYTRSEYRRFRRYGWVYLVMFSLLYLCLYCCRLNLSNASAAMIDGLGWTTSDIGILTSTLFWTYGAGQLVNGRLSEVVGPNRLITVGAACSVACNLLMGLQSSLVLMAVVWGLNGFFQSMGWAPGMAGITKWWPGGSRGFATGFAHAASGFGQAAATLAVAAAFALAPDMGWQAAFVLPAAVPLVLLVAFRLIARPSPQDVGLREYAEEDPQLAKAEEQMRQLKESKGKLFPYKFVLKNRQFAPWMFVSFATGLARYGLITWVPLYFVQVHGVDVTAGLLQSLMLPVGMGVGTLVIPWLTDHFFTENRMSAAILASLVTTAAVAVFFLVQPVSAASLAVVEAALFVAGFGIYGINGIVWAYATDIGGRVFTGTASGLLNCAEYVGAALQSLVYGAILTAGGWSIVFASLAAFCLAIAAVAAACTRRTGKS